MNISQTIRLDDITGTISYRSGSLARVKVTSCPAGWTDAQAHGALYFAVLDGRAQVSDDLARAIDPVGPSPRITQHRDGAIK